MLSSESSISSGGRTDTGISSQGSSKTNSIALVPSPTQVIILGFVGIVVY